MRRLFLLLDAYERLATRQRRALNRGEIDEALELGSHAIRLAGAMRAVRPNAVLSDAEKAAFHERVCILQSNDRANLEFLGEQRAQARAALEALHVTAQRTRQVKRGYGQMDAKRPDSVETVLGSA